MFSDWLEQHLCMHEKGPSIWAQLVHIHEVCLGEGAVPGLA